MSARIFAINCSTAHTEGFNAFPIMSLNISINIAKKSMLKRQNKMSRIFCNALTTGDFCGSGMISACRFLNTFVTSLTTLSLIRLTIFLTAADTNLAAFLTNF